MPRIVTLVVTAFVLAGCAGEGFSLTGATSSQAPDPTVNMSGRWMLAEPNAPACGMAFGAPAGAREGTIAPEGGCPGTFFTSRHWAFEQGELVIKDHNNEPLAHLKLAGARFDGKAANGAPVTLSR